MNMKEGVTHFDVVAAEQLFIFKAEAGPCCLG